jgi:aquaporin Z
MNHNTLVESSFSATCNSPIETIPKVDVSTEVRRSDRWNAVTSLHRHWPEYLMEVGEVGVYLCVACLVATLLQHPASIVRQFVSSGIARRALMGLAMGATAIAIVMPPWGKRSGGHFNPAVTFAFYRLRKLGPYDMRFFVVAQFIGAIVGVAVARYVLRGALGNHAVRYAVTVPGTYGTAVAFMAELAISFLLMITILFTTNHKRLAPYTAYANGAILALYYIFEAPLSGMSTNPARTFGSAFHASYWHALWVYFIAPSMGMLAAAEVSLRIHRGVAPYCAKLHHANDQRCIFHHAHQNLQSSGPLRQTFDLNSSTPTRPTSDSRGEAPKAISA